MVLIYQAALDLLRQYEVHPEITSQMFAYLFFFSNTLLFNQLLDKGQSLSSSWFSLIGLMLGIDLLRPPRPSRCPLGRGALSSWRWAGPTLVWGSQAQTWLLSPCLFFPKCSIPSILLVSHLMALAFAVPICYQALIELFPSTVPLYP